MTAQVVSIGLADSLPPGEACQGVIDLLRSWLKDAEAGELRQVVIGGVTSGGGTRSAWAGIARNDMTLAAAAGLHARVAKSWCEELEE